jgi:hypothetical protein
MAIPAMAPLESLGPGGAGDVDDEDVGAEDVDFEDTIAEDVIVEDIIVENIIAEDGGFGKDVNAGGGVTVVASVLAAVSTVCGKASEVGSGTVTDDTSSETYGMEPYGIGEGYAMLGTLWIHQGRVV